MKKIAIILFTIITLNAASYTNDLIRCMIKNTNDNDIKILKTWIFFAYAQDSDLKQYTKIPKSKVNEVNKKMGHYVTQIFTDKCKREFKAAIKHDGKSVIPTAFGYIGKIAGSAISSSSEVKKFLSQFVKYIDTKKIQKAIE